MTTNNAADNNLLLCGKWTEISTASCLTSQVVETSARFLDIAVRKGMDISLTPSYYYYYYYYYYYCIIIIIIIINMYYYALLFHFNISIINICFDP